MGNEAYGGFWYNEHENNAVFCVLTHALSATQDLYYPTLYKIDLATNAKRQIFPVGGVDLSALIIPTWIEIDTYERPVISFNIDTKTYNVSFLSFNASGDVQMHTFDIVEIDYYKCELSGTPLIHVLCEGAGPSIT